MSAAVKPGVYPGLSMPAYLSLSAVAAGVLRAILNECPKQAWFESYLNPNPEREDTHVADAGSICHSILLEGDASICVVIDPRDYPAEKTGNIPDGWTNKAIKAARDEARAIGKIPVFLSDMHAIERMVDSAWEFIESLKVTEPRVYAAFQLDQGDSELSALFDADGVLCRMRPDRVSSDRRVMVHLKTTERSVNPEGWARTQMGPKGHWLTAALYRYGGQQVFGVASDQYFLNVSQDAPHLCSLVGIDPAGLAYGQEQMNEGLALWKRCVEANHFPAYPNVAVYPEVPAYEIARWQERTAVREGNPYVWDQMFERKAA